MRVVVGEPRGVWLMRPMRYILAAAALTLFGQGALAFQETTIGGGEAKDAKAQAAPVTELSGTPAAETGKGLTLTPGTPGLHMQTPGTEIKIPGLGTVGVLPKLDLGLELLHGANEQKGTIEDKGTSDDVQLRGTIKYRF
jgi:hypothetical protein